MSLQLSDEQIKIINFLKKSNVICDSVAGSGKTTTILHIAKAFKTKSILLLTYNARLKLETRQKVNLENINNLEVHSYHSFCVKYYKFNCFNDNNLKLIINENLEPLSQFAYDIIIIDEVQDMTPLYYELVCKICYNNSKTPKLCITGDKYQSIYGFNFADERYLIYADQLFKFNCKEWITSPLSISFRLPDTIANFINNCVLNEDRIRTVKISKFKPRYIICNTFISKNYFAKNNFGEDLRVYNEVLYYINLGYRQDDIFILAPTIKSKNCPAKVLANKISVSKQIKIFLPTSDNEKIDQDNIKDKLVFLTFHQAKGLERKVCIVYGIDSSYFEHFKPDAIDTKCPNEIYVALTRSTERLSIFHHDSNGFIPFLNTSNLDNYVDVIGKFQINSKSQKNTQRHLQIYQLTDYVPSLVIDMCMNNVKVNNIDIDKFIELYKTNSEFKIIEDEDKLINIPSKIKCGDSCESVSNINNLGIFEYYRYKKYKTNEILRELNIILEKNRNNKFKQVDYGMFGIDSFIDKISCESEISLDDFLKMCNIYIGIKNDCIFKIRQITNFNWLEEENINKCFNRLSILEIDSFNKYKLEIKKDKILLQKIISDFSATQTNKSQKKPIFNIDENELYFTTDLKLNLKGCIDKVNDKYIMKIIFAKEIESTHIIHALIEKYIYLKNQKINLKCYIFNVLTNQLIELLCDNVIEIYNLLILNKFIGFKQLTYKSFITDNLDLFNRFYD